MKNRRLIVAVLLTTLANHESLAGDKKKPPPDSAGIGGRPTRIPVDLSPSGTEQSTGLQKERTPGREITLGGWSYTASRAPDPRDGVPWVLTARPVGPDADQWRPQAEFQPIVQADSVPIARVPSVLWKSWFGPDMQDVVGIHYHEFTTNDLARVLVTIHKVPADPPDGTQGPPPVATRLEATLLTPLTYSIDQTIVVRTERDDPGAVTYRTDHERGHAAVSLDVLLDTLAGPQDWNPSANAGRRATLAWFWRSSKIYRRWDSYRGGKYDLATLRTSITLVPPTRWSKLIPTPPERLDPAEVQRLNDDVVLLTEQFFKLDRNEQQRFHSAHGEFDQSGSNR